MPQITIQATQEEIDLIVAHKAMLRANNWSEYIILISHFPRFTDDFGGMFESRTPDKAKKMTLKVNEHAFMLGSKVRRNAFRSWRSYVLEAALHDGAYEVLLQFQAVSKIVRNKGLDLWLENVGA